MSSCIFMFVTSISPPKKTYYNKNTQILQQSQLSGTKTTDNPAPPQEKNIASIFNHLQTPRDHRGFLELTKTSWWFQPNPFEKYDLVKLENISPGFGVNITNIWGQLQKWCVSPTTMGVFLLKMTIFGVEIGGSTIQINIHLSCHHQEKKPRRTPRLREIHGPEPPRMPKYSDWKIPAGPR